LNQHQCYLARMLRMLGLSVAVLGAVCSSITLAWAHKVNVFAYVEGDTVIVEGYFSASVKAQDCPVEVFNEGGKKIHQGKTNQKGIYTFKLGDLPAFSGGLRIVLEGGMGHKADYTVGASDIPAAVKKEGPPKEQTRSDKSHDAPASPAPAAETRVADQAALVAAIEIALDKKLDPVVRMLAKQEKLLLEQQFGGPKMTDIVGGIGWIMGMVGLTAFFMSRKRTNGKQPR
jgi:nickel transport protein